MKRRRQQQQIERDLVRVHIPRVEMMFFLLQIYIYIQQGERKPQEGQKEAMGVVGGEEHHETARTQSTHTHTHTTIAPIS
jgi:hypothetical protein